MGPYCKSCPTCNGLACRNTIPGPCKGIGTGFIRNYQNVAGAVREHGHHL